MRITTGLLILTAPLLLAAPAIAQCEVLLKDTFTFGDRPHGGGNLRPAEMEDILRDYWPQAPSDGTRWRALDVNGATWRFGASSTLDLELPADPLGGIVWADGGATTVIPFNHPGIASPVTVKVETVLFGGVPYMGFTSNPALTDNFETYGTLWMTLDDNNFWRIFANGTELVASGQSNGMGTIDTGYLHMEFTFDPVASTVSGRVMEMLIPPTPVTLTRPLAYFGMEAHGGMVVMNDVAITTGTPLSATVLPPAPVCPGGIATITAQTNALGPSVIRWCDQYGWPLSEGVQPSGSIVSGADTATLTILNTTAADAMPYFVTVASGCGSTISNRAVLSICIADHNCSGTITVQDIFDFLSDYFAGNSAADVNHAGGLTVQDIFDFLGAYFAGCP